MSCDFGQVPTIFSSNKNVHIANFDETSASFLITDIYIKMLC